METHSKYRRVGKVWYIVSLAFTVFALLSAIWYTFNIIVAGTNLIDVQYFYLLVSFLLPLSFIWIPLNRKAPRDRVPFYDAILFIIAFIIPFYFSFNAVNIVMRGWSVTAPSHVIPLCFILWAVAIEIGRRTGGIPLAIVVGVISFYPVIAWMMPGVLTAKPFTLARTAKYHMFSEDAFFGIPVKVFSRLFFGYIVFAVALTVGGAGKMFTDLAARLVGRYRGGNAKIAILSSAFFGSISGSPVPNVLTTGTFTIPAMKSEGISPEIAGGVEAVASTGGAILPPIMGAVAFIMSEILGISYIQVCAVAVVPALLYYLTLFLQVDAYSARRGLVGQPAKIGGPSLFVILAQNFHLIISFLALIFILFVLRLESMAPWIATGIVFVLGIFRAESRLTPRQLVYFLERLGKMAGEIVGIIGPVGLIIGAFVLTGIAYSIPYRLVNIAGGNLFLLLAIGAISSLILGMGVPISACYILLAVILAPGLVKLGINPLAAHFFVLYCGLWSYLTPPVALSAFAAATIANASPIKCGLAAMRLGIVIFIIPFFAVMDPALIMQGPANQIIFSVTRSVLGFFLIAGSIEKYFWIIGTLNIFSRTLLFAGGMLLAFPNITANYFGLGISVVVFGVYIFRKLLIRARGQAVTPKYEGG